MRIIHIQLDRLFIEATPFGIIVLDARRGRRVPCYGPFVPNGLAMPERVMPESEVQCVYGYSRFGKTEPFVMSWYTVFRLRQFTLGSLWVLPLVGGLIGERVRSVETRGRDHGRVEHRTDQPRRG